MRITVTIGAAALAASTLIAAPASWAATTLMTERLDGGVTTAFTVTGNSGIDNPGPVMIDGFRVTGDPQVTYGNSRYRLGGNGAWENTSWVGTNDAYGSITFDLGASFASAGAFLNYVPTLGSDLTIAASNAAGLLIGRYDIGSLAPIATFGEVNGGAFRGIYSSNSDIRYLTLSGKAVVARSLTTTAAVPEPATWALMILGFGMIGNALRRQRATAVA